MALRIGKKKAAATDEVGDFSPESLQQATLAADTLNSTVAADETTVYSTTPITTHTEPNFDLEPDTAYGAAPTPFDTNITHTETVHTQTVDTEEAPIVVPVKKKVPLPALLALGALGLLGLGALAWSKMAPAEEAEEAPITARRPASRPTPAKTVPTKVIVVKGAPIKPALKTAIKPVLKTATTKTVTTQTTAKTVSGATPGALTTAATTTTTKTTVATALVPDQQAAATAIATAPRMDAPVDAPAPVVFPLPAAQPGKWADPEDVVVVQSPRIAPKVAPAVKARLKTLWEQGADAKHRKDYAGARRAWNAALKLAPDYPGFADSLAKLPR